MVEAHPRHQAALRWLQRVRSGEDIGVVAAHSLVELYAVLTRLPLNPRIAPVTARQLIVHNVLDVCETVSLTAGEYADLVDHLSQLGITGGATYDSVIMHSAAKAQVERIVTLNDRDLRRVYPRLAEAVVAP